MLGAYFRCKSQTEKITKDSLALNNWEISLKYIFEITKALTIAKYGFEASVAG